MCKAHISPQTPNSLTPVQRSVAHTLPKTETLSTAWLKPSSSRPVRLIFLLTIHILEPGSTPSPLHLHPSSSLPIFTGELTQYMKNCNQSTDIKPGQQICGKPANKFDAVNVARCPSIFYLDNNFDCPVYKVNAKDTLFDILLKFNLLGKSKDVIKLNMLTLAKKDPETGRLQAGQLIKLAPWSDTCGELQQPAEPLSIGPNSTIEASAPAQEAAQAHDTTPTPAPSSASMPTAVLMAVFSVVLAALAF